ncbi:MAG TPA: hypothetical protein PKY31_11410 [Spirochaetota bacterium]|nr:hypothetical protein [Spirochaetota bacterium]
MMTREEKLKTIKGLYWDYHIDPEEYLGILEGKVPDHGPWLNREKIVIRMLERLYWYTLVEFFGMDGLKEVITPEVIARLRFPFMRRKYEYVRKVLHGEPVSDSGWGNKGDERYTYPLLSHRWYRTK